MLNYQRVYSLANQARFCAQIQTRFWDEHQDVKQEPLAPGNDWKNWEWFAWFVRKISPNQWFNRKLKNQVIHQGANVTSMSECGPRDRNMSEWGDEHPAKKTPTVPGFWLILISTYDRVYTCNRLNEQSLLLPAKGQGGATCAASWFFQEGTTYHGADYPESVKLKTRKSLVGLGTSSVATWPSQWIRELDRIRWWEIYRKPLYLGIKFGYTDQWL